MAHQAKGIRAGWGIGALVLGVLGVACQGEAPSDSLLMVTVPDYCPYEFVAEDGAVVGFDIDLAQAIAQELGNAELTIQTLPHFNQIIPTLRQGEVDFAMAAMTPTPARRQVATFSDIYYTQKIAIVSAATEGFSDLESLIGKRVGVRTDSAHAETLMIYSAIEIQRFAQTDGLIAAVKRRKLDAAILDQAIAPKYTTPASQLTWFPVEPLTDVAGVAIAFPKNTSLVADTNAAIKKLTEDGTLLRLIHQWFDDYQCWVAPEPS